MNKLTEAIALAVAAHEKQKLDEDGMPHIVHCMEVMLKVKTWVDNHNAGYQSDRIAAALQKYTFEELLIGAVLHDTVEDSEGLVTLKLIEDKFGTKVRWLVDGLTRRGLGEDETKETYKDFIYRAKKDPGTALIKSADLEHNRGRAFKIKSASWRDKLEFKYGVALRVLSSDEPTWEEASWNWTVDKGHSIADPNGKKIFLSELDFQALKATWATA